MPVTSDISTKPPAVRLRGIRKTFGHVIANNGIDLDIQAGEIHALLGENGAGKTTLMNILYGLVLPDEGTIGVHGQPVKMESPSDAIAHGIAMVHQHFMLVSRFSVVENIVLGLGTPDGPVLSLSLPAKRIDELSNLYGLKVDPWAEISQLSVGEQQRVEIIKALYRNVDVLILDEPTSVLTPQEVDQLFKILRAFTGEGHTVIFISHKLNEVLTISDRVTVLRDGEVIGTVETKTSSKAQLARMMVGREISLDYSDESRSLAGQTVLELKNVSAKNERDLQALFGVSLEVHSGEILGIAGVDGNGQRELCEIIVGLRRVTQGQIFLERTEITNQTPHEAISRGIAFVPGDRQESGLLSNLPLWRNLLLGLHDRPPYVQWGLLKIKTVMQMAERLLKQFEVRPADLDLPAGSLSGGNQQKLVLAREVNKHPRLLIASQPTLGLDIKTTDYVHRLLIRERESSTSILLISTDLQEILSLSDRVAVMYEGKVMGVLDIHQASIEKLGLLMAGVPLSELGEAAHA